MISTSPAYDGPIMKHCFHMFPLYLGQCGSLHPVAMAGNPPRRRGPQRRRSKAPRPVAAGAAGGFPPRCLGVEEQDPEALCLDEA